MEGMRWFLVKSKDLDKSGGEYNGYWSRNVCKKVLGEAVKYSNSRTNLKEDKNLNGRAIPELHLQQTTLHS